ncbi:ABC transporter B family member 27-like [Ipomoea triloba]|uniref:ABC transporter B family member 27-like n=1 Tax=Ipomoea triloba TaxID=35885 RepID=UPI00125CE743|nr:ABC transporter B family member 27-like [Ipomoea triloba]
MADDGGCSRRSRLSGLDSAVASRDDGVQLNVGVSNGAFVPPKYGGTIINIVSRDTRTHEQQAEALDDVKNTVLAIVLKVVIGYEHLHL